MHGTVKDFIFVLSKQLKPLKITVMKKFIFTANVIAIIALVPAVIFGYLHNETPGTDKKASTEIVNDVTNGQDDGSSIHLVKTF